MRQRLARRGTKHRQRGPHKQADTEVERNGARGRLHHVAKECRRQAGCPDGETPGLARHPIRSPQQDRATRLQGEEDRYTNPAAVAKRIIKNIVRCTQVRSTLR